MGKDEALQMCLEYIETDAHERKYVRHAIKAALAQPAQEPVCDKDPQGCWNVRCQLGKKCINTTPPQRPWVGLTDEEIAQGNKESWVDKQAWQSAVWWAEAKLKDKNNG